MTRQWRYLWTMFVVGAWLVVASPQAVAAPFALPSPIAAPRLPSPQQLTPYTGYTRTTQKRTTLPRRRFGTLRQPQLALNGDLLTAGMIVLIPTVAIELTLFIGNLAAFSMNKRLLAWGIQGMAFSLLGGAVTLPWIILGLQEGIAVSFIALHLALLGVGIANTVLGIQARQRKQKVAILPWGYVSPGGVAQGGIACTGVF